MSSNGSSRIAASAVLTLVLVLCAACGSSADDGASTNGTAPTTTTPAKPPAAGPQSNDAAYCKAALAIDTAPGPQIDFATASEAEVASGLKAYAADTLGPLLDDIERVAPAELADAVATYRKAIDQVAETGDASAFDDPAVDQALDRVIAAARAAGIFPGCGGIRDTGRQAAVIRRGARFLTTQSDVALLHAGAKAWVDGVRGKK